jgi:hypothetical protein
MIVIGQPAMSPNRHLTTTTRSIRRVPHAVIERSLKSRTLLRDSISSDDDIAETLILQAQNEFWNIAGDDDAGTRCSGKNQI